MKTLYLTLPDQDLAVRVDGPDEWEIFEQAAEAGIPSYDAGVRAYSNPEHDAVAGRRIITLDQFEQQPRPRRER